MKAYGAENLGRHSGLCFCSAWLDTDLCTVDCVEVLSGTGILIQVHPLVASHAVVCGAVPALLLNGGVSFKRAVTQRRKTCVTCNS